jgi:hypothetical protein
VLTKSVDSYDTDTAEVTLIHSTQRVTVDVSLLVEDLRFTQGEWINVIGYLEEEYEQSVMVKGIMVWGVSPGFDLLAYEDSVTKRMEATL